MAIMNGKMFTATVSQGEKGILQDSESDVSLHIQKGSAGVYKKCVHTDHSRFKGEIPGEECIITPLVEIHHLETTDAEEENKRNFVIKLPHCIPEQELWKQVKVRKWRSPENGMASQELTQKEINGWRW